MKKQLLAPFLFLIFFLTACEDKPENGSGKSGKATPKPKQQPLKKAPVFSQDSAYAFVEKQLAFGPRVPGTPQHKACGDWLEEKLRSFGATVVPQPFVAEIFDGSKVEGRNIIGTFSPEKRKRILLAAHWDTRPFADHDDSKQEEPILGANDGASGVAVLLEVARVLQKEAPNVGVDIVFFDVEDYGEPDHKPTDHDRGKVHWCLGSQHWAKTPHLPNYSAYYGILLDMVGGHGATFYEEGSSMSYAPKVVDKVWTIAHRLGYRQYFIKQAANGSITDDHVFVNEYAKIPMIDIIQHDPSSRSYFASYWHTHEDNLDAVSKATLGAVGSTVVQVLWEE